MSSELVSISDVCELVTDGTHYTPADLCDGIPFLTVKDMSFDGSLDLVGSAKIGRAEFQKAASGNSAPLGGDVLFSKDGTVGKVSFVTGSHDFAVLSSIAILRPDPKAIDPLYLASLLRSPLVMRQANKSKTGSALRRIILKDLKRVRFPLPPLPEQRRIAAILAKADALRQKRREAIAKLDQLLQSVFLELFGDPVSNPKNWPIQLLGDICRNEDSRRRPIKRADRESRSGPYDYYGASGVIDDFDDYLFDGERLLIGEDGANLLGRSAPIAFIARGRYWVNNHAHVLAEDSLADLRYLEYAIENKDLAAYVTGTAQPKLNRANLDRVNIPCPPVPLQKKFRAFCEGVERQKSAAIEAERRLAQLFGSCQQRAFTGQL